MGKGVVAVLCPVPGIPVAAALASKKLYFGNESAWELCEFAFKKGNGVPVFDQLQYTHYGCELISETWKHNRLTGYKLTATSSIKQEASSSS